MSEDDIDVEEVDVSDDDFEDFLQTDDEEVEEEEVEEDEEEEEPLVALSDDTMVKVRYSKNGPEEEITLAELKAGNIRHSDYTRRTQEVAETRRQLEEQLTAWAIQEPPEPDWIGLAQQMNPQDFQVYRMHYEAQTRQANEAKYMIQQMHQQQSEEYAAQVMEHNEREAAKLVQKFPDLQDQAKRTHFYSKISTAAQKYGFTEEELQDIPDGRYVEALYDLAQFMDKQGQRPAVDKRIAATSQRLSTSAPPAKVSTKTIVKAARQKIRASEGSDDKAFADFLFSGSS